jgi:hypothetical protein
MSGEVLVSRVLLEEAVGWCRLVVNESRSAHQRARAQQTVEGLKEALREKPDYPEHAEDES